MKFYKVARAIFMGRKVSRLICLALCLFAGQRPVRAQLSYSTNAGILTVTGYSGPGGVITIPATNNGLAVTAIQSRAFIGNTNITSIAVPATVTSIGSDAFLDCANLAAITVDSQNPKYSSANGVLFDKNQITLVCLPGGLVGSYTVPSTVTAFAVDATAFCANLTNVTIPPSVTVVGEIFNSCSNLITATIGDGVTNLGVASFAYCPALTSVYFQGNAPVAEAGFVFQGDAAATAYYVPGAIGWGTNYSGIPAVQMPATDPSQFTYTTNGGAITITGYTGAGGIVIIPSVISGLPVTSIAPSAFSFDDTLTFVAFPTNLSTIGDDAFEFCDNLNSVLIPPGVTSIGNEVFQDCVSLAGVTLPSSVTTIGTGAFQDCFNLANLTLSSNLSIIGDSAFNACVALKNITFPASVMSLGDSAFDFCLNLSNVYSYGNAPAVGSGVFNGDSVTTVYYMPGTTGWSSTLATATAVLWNPQIQTNSPNFGVVSNQFGFNITGTSNDPVLLEVCTNLASQVWTPLTNVSLSNGLYYYSEPMQSNAAVRFYRIVLP